MRLVAQVIELKPTVEQESIFYQHSEASRIARNDLIAEAKRRIEKDGKVVLKELRPWFNAIKGDQRAWMLQCSQNAVKGGLIDAVDAFKRFFSGKSKFPRFEPKGRKRRFRIDNGTNTVKVEQREGRTLPFLKLPVIGAVRMKEALRWPEAQVRECRIRYKGGKWFASVLMNVPDEELNCGNGVCGIDLGVKTFATIYFDDGRVEKIDAPRPLRRMLVQLRRAQQALARKKRGSINRGKAKRRVARLMYRVSCIRKDFLHKLSHVLCMSVGMIKLETLSLSGWMKRWGRVVGDIAPYEFIRQLTYKMAWRGGDIDKADRSFPSSKLCSSCGARNDELKLSDRVWRCLECGVEHDRDVNAARNLWQWKSTSGVTGASKRQRASADSLWRALGS